MDVSTKIEKWDEIKPRLMLMQSALQAIGFPSPEDWLHTNGVCTDGLEVTKEEFETLIIGVLLGMAINEGIVGTKVENLASIFDK